MDEANVEIWESEEKDQFFICRPLLFQRFEENVRAVKTDKTVETEIVNNWESLQGSRAHDPKVDLVKGNDCYKIEEKSELEIA